MGCSVCALIRSLPFGTLMGSSRQSDSCFLAFYNGSHRRMVAADYRLAVKLLMAAQRRSPAGMLSGPALPLLTHNPGAGHVSAPRVALKTNFQYLPQKTPSVTAFNISHQLLDPPLACYVAQGPSSCCSIPSQTQIIGEQQQCRTGCRPSGGRCP